MTTMDDGLAALVAPSAPTSLGSLAAAAGAAVLGTVALAFSGLREGEGGGDGGGGDRRLQAINEINEALEPIFKEWAGQIHPGLLGSIVALGDEGNNRVRLLPYGEVLRAWTTANVMCNDEIARALRPILEKYRNEVPPSLLAVHDCYNMVNAPESTVRQLAPDTGRLDEYEVLGLWLFGPPQG